MNEAKEQAAAHYESILQLVQEAKEDGSYCVHDSPLCLMYRSGWQTIGEKLGPAEYQILLMTGGPAVRIVGDLDMDGVPTTATLQFSNWFHPWSDYLACEPDVLLAYARSFYFCA
jgi:hypothetical protein